MNTEPRLSQSLHEALLHGDRPMALLNDLSKDMLSMLMRDLKIPARRRGGKQARSHLNKASFDALVPKLEAFGWHTQEIDGHSFPQILTAVEAGKSELKRPSVILAHTVKGQGVPFMVGDNSWHKRVPTREELESALESIGAS